MKTLILSILLLATQANATCLETTLKSMRGPGVAEQSAEQKECIASTVAADAMTVLCANETMVTSEFREFLSYQKLNKQLWQEFAQARATQNHADAALALRKINSLDFEWSAAGFRAEINSALVKVMEADYHCRRRN